MRMQNALGVSLLVLVMVSLAGAQDLPYSSPGTLAPSAAGQGMSVPQGAYSPQGYGVQPQSQPTSQDTYSAPPGGTSEWPYYPYPPYHNPYYSQGMNVREALLGTIDWFVALPSNLMDRVSGFLDSRVFPQQPATQGLRPDPQPSVPIDPNPGSAPVLPQAEKVAPTHR